MQDTNSAVVSQLNQLRMNIRALGASGGVNVSSLEQGVNAALATARYAATEQSHLQNAPSSRLLRPLPTGGLRPQGITQVTHGTSTNVIPVQWPVNGICIGIGVGTLENTAASLGAMELRVTYTNGMGSTADLFTNGFTGSFVKFSTVFYNDVGQGIGWPMAVAFTQSQQWQVYFQNVGSSDYTPDVTFYYVAM